ncbi:MAG: FapA family protein [Lachnospiraceae bacterium]|nr:FapA family protein [Lachnospiraceae bacterium]
MGELVKLSAEELAKLREEIKKSAPVKSEETVTTEMKVADNDFSVGKTAERNKKVSTKQVTVTIAEDKMSATVVLDDPGEEEYTAAEIVGILRRNKVITGINSVEIIRMVNEKVYDKEVVVANGKPMEPGQEGYYEFMFDTEVHKTPVIREDGTADYAAVGRHQNVKEGDVVAVYHPAVQGQNGFNVCGMEIIAKFSKELPALRGQRIKRNDETNEYIATLSGKISLNDYNIEILDVHEINDNVTMLQGKVEFYGDIIINGDVENGVVIRAGRNVVINGTVGAASIFAGGDIILQKGIQGAGRGKVSARGNIFSDFVEYARVNAGLDIYANSIINSNIATSGSVIVSGKHGSIIGGDTHGLKGITANATGNLNEVKTVLHAGFLEEDYMEFSALMVSEKKKQTELENVVDEITVIIKSRAKGGTMTKAMKLGLLKLKEKKDQICTEIDEINEKKTDISRRMAEGNGASVTMRGDIYPNVYICIDTAKLRIARKESYTRYVCKNNMIERRTIPIGSI